MFNLGRVGVWAGLLVAASICGCSVFGNSPNSANLLKIEIGMTKNEVVAIMGQAPRREAYGSTEFLIYSTDGSSNTALLNFTPIAIVDGRVTGIGRDVYEAVVRSKTQSDRESPRP